MGNTLVRGLEKFGGKIQLNAHVDEIIVKDGKAVGVRLKNGKVVNAKKAVVSNATPFDTVKMLGECLCARAFFVLRGMLTCLTIRR